MGNFYNSSQQNHRKSKVDKSRKTFNAPFPTSYCLFKFVKPRKKAFNFPSSFVTAQEPSVLRRRLFTILAVRRDEFNSLRSKGFIKRIAVIGTIPNNSSGSSHRDNFIDCSLDKSDLMRVSRIRVHGDR